MQYQTKINYEPSRQAALNVLAKVDPAQYSRSRNFLDGAVTGLSPWITHGYTNVREATQILMKKYRLSFEDKLIFEFAWREFFKHVHGELGNGILSDVRRPVWAGRYGDKLPDDIRLGRTGIAAIDAGVVRDLGRQWNAAPVPVGSRTIKDSHAMGASMNVPQALVHSSNTVTARVADELGPERMRRAMVDLGMDRRPSIELPGKGRPLWPKGNWSRVTNMTVGFGHGLSVTPLHLAVAYSAMVNGGIWRPATLMKLAPADVPQGRRVFKESTSSRMRQMLRMISLYGTGKSADAPGYRVGGKTGSAEKASGGGYNKTSLVSSFAAAFPLDAPRYVVVVVMDEPKGTVASSFQRTAAYTTAPVVGKLVPRIGPMLGVQPDDTRDVDISDLRYLVDRGE